MTEKKIIEEMARMEDKELFCFVEHGVVTFTGKIEGQRIQKRCPNYLADHNAVQRVINGLDDDELCNYVCVLETIIEESNWRPVSKLMRATCPQKCEAILKAMLLWNAEKTGDQS